eukprot:7985270-Karenia_brevis.AAC.1
MAGTPLTWRKMAGGFDFEWIGHWQDIRRFQVGISVSRTVSLQIWSQQLLDNPASRVRTVVEVLGRLCYTMTAVPILRPIWGPLFEGRPRCRTDHVSLCRS